MDTPTHIEETLKLIAGILIQRASCFLPGFGLLKTVYHPAREKDNKILPPFTEIIIEEDNTKEAHQIIFEIQDRFRVNTENAKRRWEEVLNYVNAELKENRNISIPGLGQLKQKDEKHFIFVQNPPIPFYKPIQNPKEHFENPEYDIDPLPKEEKEYKKRKLLYTLLALVAIFIVGGFFYFYFATDIFNRHPQNLTEKTVTTKKEKQPSSDQVNTKDSGIVKTQNAETLPASDSIHFVIVYRKSTSKTKAIHDYKQKTNWGYHVAVYTKNADYFLVGYPYYALPKDTTEKRKEKHDIYGVKTWVIYPDRQGYHKVAVQ